MSGGAPGGEEPIGPGEPRVNHAGPPGGLTPPPYGDRASNRFHSPKQHGANAPLAAGVAGRAP